jgi:hypothetical protein
MELTERERGCLSLPGGSTVMAKNCEGVFGVDGIFVKTPIYIENGYSLPYVNYVC